MKLLKEILRYKRPAWSDSEERFVERFIEPLPTVEFDKFGNAFVTIGNGDAPVIFSAHIDTVHRESGMQIVKTNKAGMLYSKGKDCLGADDGAGIWILLNLIKRGIEGTYIFHRAEEVGCKGAEHIAHTEEKWLAAFQMCLAFDRRGLNSIVTHQMGLRCCSTDFAVALCEQLDMGHLPDDSGVFTDNVEYTALIPEVTNISVGYEGAHGNRESLNPRYLSNLLDGLCAVDYSALPILRDPSIEPVKGRWPDYSPIHNYGGGRCLPDMDNVQELQRMIIDCPDVAAELLDSFGISPSDFMESAYEMYGILPSHLCETS